MIWNQDNTITVDPPKRPKKCTGTRFAAIMGLNKWTSPFNAWCAITRTYEEPFQDTIYTIAGKTIEPKQAAYIADKYFWKKLVTPEDMFGKNYFQKTFGDFFKEDPIFGGMWDYLFTEKDEVKTVLEMKTTKRVEDWLEDIPEYYARQAALYAYLLDVDDVTMVCTVLSDEDYEHPEDFEVNEDNTFERSFKVSERYPDFESDILWCREWWDNHVLTGNSPEYDEKVDADILKELRKNNLNPQSDIEAFIAEAEQLKDRIDAAKKVISDDEKRYKKLTDMIKKYSLDQFRDGDKEVCIPGSKYNWVTSRSVSTKVDEDKLKEDGILEKYQIEKESYRFTLKLIK